MVERMYKKGLVVGIIILFIGVGIQPALAVESKSSSLNEKPREENGLPDLIVEDIYYYPFENGWDIYLVNVKILNQGDTYAYGNITVEFTIIRTIFWFFNLRIYQHNTVIISLDNGLAPGEKITCGVSGWISLEFFGFYKFNAGINLDKKIEESNYNNNERMERVTSIAFWWF
jgi:hypothetical protein